jgi:hypothetical protein
MTACTVSPTGDVPLSGIPVRFSVILIIGTERYCRGMRFGISEHIPTLCLPGGDIPWSLGHNDPLPAVKESGSNCAEIRVSGCWEPPCIHDGDTEDKVAISKGTYHEDARHIYSHADTQLDTLNVAESCTSSKTDPFCCIVLQMNPSADSTIKPEAMYSSLEQAVGKCILDPSIWHCRADHQNSVADTQLSPQNKYISSD